MNMTKKKNHRTAQPAAPSGKSTAQRQTGACAGEHDEHRIVIQLERFLNIGAAIATIIAFFVAVWQVAIGNWQFERSGPDYSGFIVQGSITSGAQVTDSTFSIQPAFAVVISNTGRTGDSILLIEQQDSGKSHPMQACIPNIDTNGNLDTSDPIKPRNEIIRLEPGQSRMIILVTQKATTEINTDGTDTTAANHFKVPTKLTIYGASGQAHDAPIRGDMPQAVIDHYRYPDIEQASDKCRDMVNSTHQ